MTTPRPVVILALLASSVAVRLVPWALASFGVAIDPARTIYPWNFSPILPIALFGGACYARRRLALGVPLLAFLLGDLGIWALSGRAEWAFYPYQPLVYLALALVATTGFALRCRRTWRGIALAGLISATLHFVLTNFGVWAFGGSYPHTGVGLVDCYVRGLPFFRNTVISMAVFLPVLFSPVSLRPVPTVPADWLPALR